MPAPRPPLLAERMPADSGAFQPVPLVPIALPVAGQAAAPATAYGSRIGRLAAPPANRAWLMLCLLVPLLQAAVAGAMVWAAMPALRDLDGPNVLLLALAPALPSLAVAPVAALFRVGTALAGRDEPSMALAPVMMGLTLWVIIAPTYLAAVGHVRNAGDAFELLVCGGLAGGFLAVVSMPGALLGTAIAARLARPIVRRHQRKARARYWLVRGWTAP